MTIVFVQRAKLVLKLNLLFICSETVFVNKCYRFYIKNLMEVNGNSG